MIRAVRAPPARPDAAPAGDPPRLLVLGPPGSGKSALCRARFDAALASGGPGSALLILPTYGEVEHEKRVAVSRRSAPPGKGGRRVYGLFDEAYATFTSLGERTVPDWRVGRLPSRIERDLLAAEALRVADVEAFRAVRDRAGFRARFLRLMKEMKQTGGAPDDLRARARERLNALSTAAARGLRSPAARERLDGFLRAWEAYDALLARSGAPDHEDALRTLLHRLRTNPPQALARLSCLAVDGFDDLSGLEASLLLACADAVSDRGGRVVVTLPFDPARAELYRPSEALARRLCDEAGFAVHVLPACRRSGDPAIAALCDGLFVRGGGVPPEVPSDGGVRSIVGCDPSDEIDRIGREILSLRAAGEAAFRDVAIVYRRLDEVGPAARRALEAMGVPTRLVGAGAPLSGEAPVRALRGPLRLLAGEDGAGGRPFDAALLLDHARWSALASIDAAPLSRNEEGPRSEEGAGVLRPDDVDRLDVLWRSEGFPGDWDAARAACARQGPGLAVWAARVERARAACARAVGPAAAFEALADAVDALLPLPDPSGFDDEGRPRDAAADARLARARTAKGALLGLSRELADAHARTGLAPGLTAGQAAALLLSAARDAGCEPPDRRLDAVALIDAEEARHWEVGVVFVAGLVEKGFPLHPREDVFLRDADREALRGDGSPELRTAREGEDRERRLFLSAVTRARTRVYLCRHASGEDGREKSPSFFWDDVARAVTLDDVTSFNGAPCDGVASESDLRAAIARSLGATPAAASDDDRRLGVALVREGGDDVASWLARAERFRRSGSDAPPAALIQEFERAVAEVSPSQVNEGLACRHRHFLHHVAGVPEDALPLVGAEPDRRDLGKHVHAALYEAVRLPEASPSEIAALVLKNARDLPASAVRDFLETDLARIVALFRVREAAARESEFLPAADRVEFGFGTRAGRPVVLGGKPFALRGQVDRVDVKPAAPAPFAIVSDYKTSKGAVDELHKDTKNEDDVQLPLYALAVERLEGVRVVALELYAASSRRRRQIVDVAHADAVAFRREGPEATALPTEVFRALLDGAEAKASRLVAETRAAVASSLRREVADASVCSECAWRGVCRPDEARVVVARGPGEDVP